MKLIDSKILSVVSGLFKSVASFGVKPACAGYIYQPKAPKSLSKK